MRLLELESREGEEGGGFTLDELDRRVHSVKPTRQSKKNNKKIKNIFYFYFLGHCSGRNPNSKYIRPLSSNRRAQIG